MNCPLALRSQLWNRSSNQSPRISLQWSETTGYALEDGLGLCLENIDRGRARILRHPADLAGLSSKTATRSTSGVFVTWRS
jgi:hypothetical protein